MPKQRGKRKNRSSKGKFSLILTVFLACAAIQLTVPGQSLANGGPLSIHAEGFGPLEFTDDSGIRLVEEEVRFRIAKPLADGWFPEAQVHIRYKLVNSSDVPADVPVLFVTPTIEIGGFQVMDNEVLLEPIWYTDPQLADWKPGEGAVFEPVSGDPIRTSSSYTVEKPAIQGGSFNIHFEPNEHKTITLTYNDSGGRYKSRYIHPVFSYLYYLTPAQYWEGQTKARFVIELADRKTALHSNLPLERVSDTEYAWSTDSLPLEEWSFTVASSRNLLWGTNDMGSHLKASMISVGCLHILLLGTAWYMKQRRWAYIAYPVSAAWFALTLHMLPKDSSLILTFLCLLLYYIVMMIAHFFVSYRYSP